MFLNYYTALLKFCVCILVVTAFGCNPSERKANISKGKFTMDQFMGINAFVDDPVDKLKAVGFIREYHNWEWDDDGKGYPKNELKWAPGIWNFDDFYQRVNQAGLEIAPCIQGNVKWLHKDLNNLADKPIDEIDTDTEDPQSYRKKAQFMFQFAARYGSTKVADSALTLADNQPRNSGMKLIRYVEHWNEQNKSWEGKNAEFSAEEYAAMASADYDGHGKTMTGGNGNFGVKNADPNIKFVMGGLAGLKLSFVKDMKRWFEKNRADKKFAADVINFHVYAWKSEDGWEDGGPAKSPEEAGFREKLEEITAYRDENLPGVEVWVSEFGWDTNPGSPLCPPVIKPFDIQEIQAQWLVRSYLAFAAAGVDRAQAYMLRDVDPKSKIWYATCGLAGPKGKWTPKKSWYYVYTLKNTLKKMKYSSEVLTDEPDLHIYKFKDIKTQRGVYALWCGSSSNKTISNYKLAIDKKATMALKIELQPGKIDGNQSALRIKNGHVEVDVTERPVFVKVDKL